MPEKNSKIMLKTMTFSAVMLALNVVMSSFSLPVPGGHLYLNDIVICTAALLLSPVYAFLVGGVGAFLGDVFFYPAPMFVSLVTHGLQAVVIAMIVRHQPNHHPVIKAILAVSVGAVIMVAGYSFGRAYIYSTPEYAILKLPFQILQAGVGAVVSVLVCYRFGLKKKFEELMR